MSSASTENSRGTRRQVIGIPNGCWCGVLVVAKVSKSENNPCQRYYRCAHAYAQKLADDNHVFKWCDEALVNEIETMSNTVDRLANVEIENLSNPVARLENVEVALLRNSVTRLENVVSTMTSYMEDQETLAREKVQKELIDAKLRMQAINIGVVVFSIVGFSIMKWLA